MGTLRHGWCAALVVVSALLAGAPCAWGESGATVAAPRSVSWSGAPRYIEFDGRSVQGWRGTAGGGVSDFGSESSVKAALEQPRPLMAATYASFGAIGRKLDRSALDVLDGAGGPVTLTRRVRFAPWGWTEHLHGSAVTAQGAAFTVATNAFAFQLTVHASRPVRVQLAEFTTPQIDESSETPLRNPPPLETEIHGRRGGDAFVVSRTYGPSGLSSGDVTVWRAWRLDGLRYAGASTAPGAFDATATSRLARGDLSVSAVMGVGLTEAAAMSAARRGARAERGDALRRVQSDWAAFLGGPAAPPPHVGAAAARAYRLAMTALRMDLVAPAGRMRLPGTFPAKVSDTAFFGWDTPLNAVGMAEWGDWQPSWLPTTGFTLAEDMILLQLRNETPEGAVCYFMTEDLRCQARQWVQIPVQGWAAWQVASRDPDRARAQRFIAAAYPGLVRYYRYVIASHTGSDGRIQVAGAAETCDDSPRASLSDPPWTQIATPQPQYEPIEYPVWLSAYATALAEMAARLHRAGDVGYWNSQAGQMTAQADGHWSDQVDGWMDRRAGQLEDVVTPLMWWPAAFGTTRHPAWSRRVLTQHALNPAEFGRYTPVPLVAVDSPFYNQATHGSYCQGEAWLLFAYGTLMALARNGEQHAADRLRARMIATANRDGGIYESYDAITGQPGYAPGLQLPTAFGYGHSAMAIVEAVRRRYSVPGAGGPRSTRASNGFSPAALRTR